MQRLNVTPITITPIIWTAGANAPGVLLSIGTPIGIGDIPAERGWVRMEISATLAEEQDIWAGFSYSPTNVVSAPVTGLLGSWFNAFNRGQWALSSGGPWSNATGSQVAMLRLVGYAT